jgi:predicted transposase YbfD/YdcC
MQSKKEFLAGFESCFESLSDKRQESKVDYPLMEILFLTLVAVAGGADSWELIESFGEAHLEVLREYYPFEKGTPSDDTIRRFFEALDPEGLNTVLQKYFARGLNLTGKHVAIDGKTAKGSAREGTRALHMLNVYASESGLTLFSKKVNNKTNEIMAIPEAIDMLDLKGATVTIDAMGCQKDIAQKIVDKGGSYIFGLKENQACLYAQVETVFETNAVEFFAMKTATTSEKGHGRMEERRCRVIQDLTKIANAKYWPSMKCVIEMKRTVTIKDKTTDSVNYYISSAANSPEQIMKDIRAHWKIESMHWMLDVVCKEDASQMRKNNIPANMAVVRHFVLNILGIIKEKRQSRPLLSKMIGWSPQHLHKFIAKLISCS